jgi:hypothetical protein
VDDSNVVLLHNDKADRKKWQIYAALNDLMNACGLSGESGTEVLFDVLFDAVHNVDEDIYRESHAEGLCFDVCALLAEQIEIALSAHDEHCQQQ